MEVDLALVPVCPHCGMMMHFEMDGNHYECLTTDCVVYGKKYRAPKIELEEITWQQ